MKKNGNFEEYQNRQSWDVFGSAKTIISFISLKDKFSMFIGVWDVLTKEECDGRWYYKTIERSGFDDLKYSLIVEWGGGTRSWAQWLHSKGNKTISELLPQNYVMEFPGFYDFTLNFYDLQMMISNPDSNREWHRMLSSVSGVYLILNKRTGQQYVGSAYGKGGIWQRWTSYAKSNHGGNKLLMELIESEPEDYQNFQISIMRVMEPSCQKDEVIGYESLLKIKLGTRTFGLNAN
ncbi:MAG: GIY-YIG nuclease family protein [Ekhidna sp.]|nr:GIY-YIG nuclease family protein [Ekhidna sp.]